MVTVEKGSEASGLRREGRPWRSAAAGGIILCGSLLLGACDMSVTNIGPSVDEQLDDPGAHLAIVGGMEFLLSRALYWTTWQASIGTKELVSAGNVHVNRISVAFPFTWRPETTNGNVWSQPQRARWTSENGVERLRRVLSAEEFGRSPVVARALLYAGYANRLSAEFHCEAVIDGGAPEPYTRYLERAQAHFTEALSVSAAAGEQQVELAARAGRASARALAGDWSGATGDAALVPEAFSFQVRYSSASLDQQNGLAMTNTFPYRTHTMWNTWYGNYYDEVGDPRVAYGTNPSWPFGEYATVPWQFTLKHIETDQPVNLSSGREMRLIEAEARLVGGDWTGAMDIINDLRSTVISDHTGAPIPALQATGLAEAWTHLKRERGIELYLEGRRLADLRRWIEDARPGAMEDMSDRIRLCFPVVNSERQTNSNVPLDHQDPVNPAYTGAP